MPHHRSTLLSFTLAVLAAATASSLPARDWAAQAAADAKEDRTSNPYDGVKPNSMVCDTTLRELPDGSWIYFILAGGDTEPSPLNYTGVMRSTDQGLTWTPLEPFDVGFPREGGTIGQGPTEVLVSGKRTTLYFSTHAKHWSTNWHSWAMHSDDNGKTWGKPEALPGRLALRTFIRPSIVAKDGRIILPFQHYIGPEDEQARPPLDRAFTNPRNGVLISSDGGKTWSEHGNIRLTEDDRYFGWAEPSIVELADGRIGMMIRADKLGGVLYYAESKDGGKTWPYQRLVVPESSDGPKGRINYPDGFVSKDRKWLHFSYDDNRHRAVHYSAKLPPLE